ncbi:formimidoylglutamate deiminase [Microvirga sp. 2MCAF38]|uniref:formimidoylglutamate deiminase n=1 Tax=Microvirga sp. 2MCAF38 TaxID=3232989 RepID=UPI003F984CCF
MALWFASALTPNGWRQDVRITIEEGLIAAVETGVPARPGDDRHGIALPGVPNLHSHAFQRGMAGLSEVRGETLDSFWTWRQVMYRFLDRLTPDDMESIAALAYAEMLESGFTRVGEFHYVHHDCNGTPYARLGELSERIAAAADVTGIGLTLLPVFYAHAGFGGLEPLEGQRRFVTSLDQFASLLEDARRSLVTLPDANIGVAPHSLRAVTPHELTHVAALAPSGPIHIHVAEQMKEVEDCLAWSGARPIAWLLDSMPVDSRWCLIHATHMTPDEIEHLARNGATVGLCPITEANLGDGVFEARTFTALGGHYGIGSDSNILIDAASELSMLEYGQRLTLRSRNVMAQEAGHSTGRSLFDAARTGGARALSLSSRDLTPGAPADIASLKAASFIDSRCDDTVLDTWIFASRRQVIDCVWRYGKKVVADGYHVDRAAIEIRYRATLARLLAE